MITSSAVTTAATNPRYVENAIDFTEGLAGFTVSPPKNPFELYGAGAREFIDEVVDY